MKKNMRTKTDASQQSGDQPFTEPVFEFDREKNELKISVPYVPEFLTVELWAARDGVPTSPPGPSPMPPSPGPGPSDAEGVPVKPPKRIEVLIEES